MPQVTLKNCDLLQVESRPYKGKDGSMREARSVLARYAGKIFMFAVSKDASIEQLKKSEGQKASLVLDMTTFGKELDPNFSVLGVEAKS